MKYVLCLVQSLIFFPLFSADYVLYEVTAFNPHEREVLYYLHITTSTITFVNGVSNEAAIPMDVIVENNSTKMFQDKLQTYDIQYIFVAHIPKNQLVSRGAMRSDINISSAFYDFENIQYWVNKNEKNNVAFNKIVIGKTYENRDIFILKINKGPKKPIVFIVGGEDGKDWISSAIVLNVFDELLNSSSNLSSLLNMYDFYLLPLLNPDGFVYSKDKASIQFMIENLIDNCYLMYINDTLLIKLKDRLWSKNRQINEQRKCNGSLAIGVNIARNWFTQKSSKGQKGLSEEETQTLSHVLNSISLNMLAFIDVRGFGRYITLPYATSSEKANNHDIVMEIIKSACTKIFQKHDGTFYYETTEKLIYNFTGNMADWVKMTLNTPVVFTVYLEDVRTVFPMPEHILPLSKEFYTLLYKSLTISKQMYGPLFNGQVPRFYFHLSINKLTITHILEIILCILYLVHII